MLIAEMDERIDEVRNRCTPETGMDDIQTERAAFNASLSTLRVSTEEAMRGLGGGNFGG
jgi:hypothetical protein